MKRQLLSIGAAFALGADLRSWVVAATDPERMQLEQTLGWLFKYGWIAGYAIEPAHRRSTTEILRELTLRCAPHVISAVSGCELIDPEVRPAFLIPVWPFEDERDGFPITTARFLGTDVQLSAIPSLHEEVGFPIPGKRGLWLPFVMPIALELA